MRDKLRPVSPSELLRPFSTMIFESVNEEIMESAKAFGREVMENLEAKQLGIEPDNNNTLAISNDIWFRIDNLIGDIKAVEQHIECGKYHGYVDVVGDNFFVEIKTRSTNKVSFMDLIQCYIYKQIFLENGEIKKCYVIIYNKKTKKPTIIAITDEDFKKNKIKQKTNALYNVWKLLNKEVNYGKR